ncbi:MAG: hypothetical protein AAF734_10380 [Bacteroidota bacterium]
MSKMKPWLGLYLWMNEERQKELEELRHCDIRPVRRVSMYRNRLQQSAKTVDMYIRQYIKIK